MDLSIKNPTFQGKQSPEYLKEPTRRAPSRMGVAGRDKSDFPSSGKHGIGKQVI